MLVTGKLVCSLAAYVVFMTMRLDSIELGACPHACAVQYYPSDQSITNTCLEQQINTDQSHP